MPEHPSVIHLCDRDIKSAGCHAWRTWQPCAALQRLGYPSEWGWNDDPRTVALALNFDAVIMPRMSWDKKDMLTGISWIHQMHARGKYIISEWDDDAFREGIIERESAFWNQDHADQLLQDEQEMRRFIVRWADGVTVTNPHLRDVVQRFTDKPVKIVGNYLDVDFWRDTLSTVGPRVAPSPSIGWAGGARFDRDVAAMAIAWGRIASTHPDVTFVVIGHQPEVIREHVPEERICRLEWLPIEHYPINYVNIDIGCCPLAAEAFNRSKTPIKAYEYSAVDACVVASPTVYRQVIRPGWNGYLAESADEWEAALTDALDHTARRQRLARNLRRDVEQKYSLASNVWRWPDAWAEIIEGARSANQRSVIISATH